MTIRRRRVECCLSVKVSSNSGERRRKFEKKNFRKFSVLRFNYERAMRLLLLLLLNLGHRLLLIRLFLSCTLERASSLEQRVTFIFSLSSFSANLLLLLLLSFFHEFFSFVHSTRNFSLLVHRCICVYMYICIMLNRIRANAAQPRIKRIICF